MPKYIVKSPVKHDGKRYGVGATITLKVDEAERLLEIGAIDDDRDTAADRKAEAARKAAEEAEAIRKAEEEAEAIRKAAEEAEAIRKAEEEAEAIRKAEAAAADPDKQG